MLIRNLFWTSLKRKILQVERKGNDLYHQTNKLKTRLYHINANSRINEMGRNNEDADADADEDDTSFQDVGHSRTSLPLA